MIFIDLEEVVLRLNNIICMFKNVMGSIPIALSRNGEVVGVLLIAELRTLMYNQLTKLSASKRHYPKQNKNHCYEHYTPFICTVMFLADLLNLVLNYSNNSFISLSRIIMYLLFLFICH